MSSPVLTLRGVTRTYVTDAGELPVLKGVDLDVSPGEIVGLIGPSGSGKSSLLHAAGLLEKPDGGTVTVAGQDCTKLGDRPSRDMPHKPGYLSIHRMDGKLDPAGCFKCHGRANNDKCTACHR